MKYHFVSCSICVLCLCFMLSACSSGTPAPKTIAVAYVAHSQSHSISVINIPADVTVSTIEIGDSSSGSAGVTPSNPQNVAVSPDGSRAYVTDGETSVWVVDTQSRAVVATIPAGTSPVGVVISPNGKNLYVTTNSCVVTTCTSSVAVIDTATSTVTSTIPIGLTTKVPLSGIAISPDSTRVYVSSSIGNSVWAIDTSGNSIVATIPTTNAGNVDLAISPDGTRVYAAGAISGPFVVTNYVDVIDTRTNAQTSTILLGNQDVPFRMAITPDGGLAYVTGEAGHVWVVDITQNVLMSMFAVSPGNPLNAVAFTPDSTRAYITCGNLNSIYVLDTGAVNVIATIPSNYPFGLTISAAN